MVQVNLARLQVRVPQFHALLRHIHEWSASAGYDSLFDL